MLSKNNKISLKKIFNKIYRSKNNINILYIREIIYLINKYNKNRKKEDLKINESTSLVIFMEICY